MITISLCMIVKDEESCLRKCLSSIKDAIDEFIIVDTGSSDKTRDIIKEFTTTEYSFPWVNDFSAARNYCFGLATMDYILWLDADDVITPENLKLLLKLKESLNIDITTVEMIYDITFNEQGECTLSVKRDKLIKNHTGFYWRYFVHEELVTWGHSLSSDIHITHTSNHGHYPRYLPNYKKRLADGYTLLPHEQYFYGGELFMAEQYYDCINILEEYINTPSDYTFEQNQALNYLCISYEITMQHERGLHSILASFKALTPTAPCCYFLGTIFQSKEQWTTAIFWFTAPTSGSIQDVSKEILTACNLQLCICYNKLKNYPLSMFYNNQVLSRDPDNLIANSNKVYYDSLKKEK